MVSYRSAGEQYTDGNGVLILVVVEDGLVRRENVLWTLLASVLILVVVEDGLVPDMYTHFSSYVFWS